MSNETATHRAMRENAVDRARTEVGRRRRLRSMADRPPVEIDDDGNERPGRHDHESAEHLRAAALGVLADRKPGSKTMAE